MSTVEFTAGGNPAMDQHPLQDAKETGISSGVMGH